MNIAVNTRLLIENKLDGIGVFTYEIFKKVCKAHPEHQFYFLFDRDYSDEFIFSENITPVIIKPQARHPFLWYIWFHISLPIVLKRIKAELLISPDGFIPLRQKLKAISVIHDLNFLDNPENLPFITGRYYNSFFPKYANRANKLITVSDFSKKEIMHHFNTQDEKIEIVNNASNKKYNPIENFEKQKVKQEFTNGKDFFIHVGSLHPRKNLEHLIKAFDKFKEKTNSDLKLVLVGQKFFLTKKLENTYDNAKYRDDIIFTGRLEQEKLVKLFASSFALFLVSKYEGFGIPILEAMNCDVPVICSDVTAMPEVAGDAALYIDPGSIDSIKNAMEVIYQDGSLRESLILKGRERRKFFSWERSAERMWDIIETVINS